MLLFAISIQVRVPMFTLLSGDYFALTRKGFVPGHPDRTNQDAFFAVKALQGALSLITTIGSSTERSLRIFHGPSYQ